MNATITWVDARHADPQEGHSVLAAITGRYPANDGEASTPEHDFWLVMPMHFERVHLVQGTDQSVRNCYVDMDGVVRKPLGAGTEEEVTHWAALPALPGSSAAVLLGTSATSAVAAATGVAGGDGHPDQNY